MYGRGLATGERFAPMPETHGAEAPPTWVGCLVMWLLSLGFALALRLAGGGWYGVYMSGGLGVLLGGICVRASYSTQSTKQKTDERTVRRS
jgi:hypothetical protein